MIKGKYIQLCLAIQFGSVNTIEFTQLLAVIGENDITHRENRN
jgi:hypothetical protein